MPSGSSVKPPGPAPSVRIGCPALLAAPTLCVDSAAIAFASGDGPCAAAGAVGSAVSDAASRAGDSAIGLGWWCSGAAAGGCAFVSSFRSDSWEADDLRELPRDLRELPGTGEEEQEPSLSLEKTEDVRRSMVPMRERRPPLDGLGEAILGLCSVRSAMEEK